MWNQYVIHKKKKKKKILLERRYDLTLTKKEEIKM